MYFDLAGLCHTSHCPKILPRTWHALRHRAERAIRASVAASSTVGVAAFKESRVSAVTITARFTSHYVTGVSGRGGTRAGAAMTIVLFKKAGLSATSIATSFLRPTTVAATATIVVVGKIECVGVHAIAIAAFLVGKASRSVAAFALIAAAGFAGPAFCSTFTTVLHGDPGVEAIFDEVAALKIVVGVVAEFVIKLPFQRIASAVAVRHCGLRP